MSKNPKIQFKNMLKFTEGLYKGSYALNGNFDINNYVVMGAHKIVAIPMVVSEMQKAGIESVVLTDANSNAYFVYDAEQRNKVREIRNQISKCMNEYLPKSQTFLSQVSKGRDGDAIRTISNLSDFQYHLLVESLPFKGVHFSAHTERNNANEISFLHSDYNKIVDCIKETEALTKSPLGEFLEKNFHAERNVMKEIESRIKNKEAVYIAFNNGNASIMISPKKTEITVGDRTETFNGNPFEEGTWKRIEMEIVTRPQPVALSEEEFNSPQREEIIDNILSEITQNETESFEVDEVLEHVEGYEADLDISDTHNRATDELE